MKLVTRGAWRLYISEDSSDFFSAMVQMFVPTIITSSFVDMLTCSDEVQSSTASFGTMAVDQARFPLVSDEEITEINETKTWMAAWAEWCEDRDNNVSIFVHKFLKAS